MSDHRENVSALDSRLADLRIGEDRSNINPDCENNNSKEGVVNGKSGPVIVNHVGNNTAEHEEKIASEPKVTVAPNNDPSSESSDTPVLSSASSTKSILSAGYFEELSRTVDKVLESGGGVSECLRSTELSYLGVTPEQCEMLLQHGEFPATPKVAPIPCTLNTPHLAGKEDGGGMYLDFRSTHPFTRQSTKTAADLSSSLSNHSSTKSLPSIVSFDSGEGESAWSSVSPTSSAWMSAASNYGSDKTKAQQFVTPPTYCNEPLQAHNWYPDLNEKFYKFKDHKSSSYQETRDQSDIPPTYRCRAQLNSVIGMNSKRESLPASTNAMYSYSGNQTYPGTDGKKKRNFRAATPRMKTVETQLRGTREHLPHVQLKTSVNHPRLPETLSFTKNFLGMPDSSTPLSQAVKSPNSSVPFNISGYRAFPVMDVSRIIPGRNLLHDVVPEESSTEIQAHRLFPLLRFLALAEIHCETASRFMAAVLELLPSSTNELISMFLRSKRDYALYYTSPNLATESVMRDAITYAHRCLREKISASEAAKNLVKAEELMMETEVDKACLKYLDAVRSSSSTPTQESLSVDSTSALNGNPLSSLNQMLEAFSPIPISLDAAGVSLASEATPSKYSKAVEVVTNWLKEHEDHPYPDDDQKSMLMSQTGLSSKEVTEIFSSKTDP